MDGLNEFRLAHLAVDYLKKSPFFETKVVENVPWFRIKWAELFLHLMGVGEKNAVISPLGYPPFSGGNNPGGNESKKKKVYHPRWKLFTSMLAGSIMKVRKLNKGSNTQRWPTSFRMLHENDGVPIDRIRKALMWYCEKLVKGGDLIRSNPEYIPICYTAQRFREKFHQVEASMERMKARHGFKEDDRPKVKIKKTLLNMTSKEKKSYCDEFGW